MSKIYKIHKWLSIVSVIFFLMFCICSTMNFLLYFCDTLYYTIPAGSFAKFW